MNEQHKKLSFAIFGNEYQAHKSSAIQKVLSVLKEKEADIYIDATFHEFMTTKEHLQVEATGVFHGNDFTADYVISMGGDGTFLKAASRVGSREIPIIGINMGRLGFLADILPSEAESMLEAVYEDNYQIEEHAAIQITTDGEEINECPFALNDIAVLKRDNASMISIRTTINEDYLVTYQADGLIVSTPTGSTAYSLSNGGPVMVPQSGNLCLTAVAPHSLNIRPIVIGDDAVVKLTVESRSHNYLVAIDGRSVKLNESTSITISKAPFMVKIVKRSGQRYFATLREKMMWGMDQRG